MAMTIFDMQERIRTTGAYTTPDGVCSRPWRNSWRASCWIGFSVLRALWRSGMSARKNRFGHREWALYAGQIFFDAERIGGRVSCEGFLGRAGYTGPVVYVANHMSMLETMVLPVLLITFGPLGIVLKKSLLDYPIAGRAFSSKPVIGLGRTNPREDLMTVLTEGEAILKSGTSLLIFPQGTRRSVFRAAQFNSIGVKLAERAGVPVVPVALRCDFLGVGRYTKDLGPVDVQAPIRFACGPVLKVGELPAKALHVACIGFIEQKIRDWGLPVADGGAS